MNIEYEFNQGCCSFLSNRIFSLVFAYAFIYFDQSDPLNVVRGFTCITNAD